MRDDDRAGGDRTDGPAGSPLVPEVAKDSGSQVLWRSLAILEAVSGGADDLKSVTDAVAINRSTAHRLLSTLVRAGLLRRLNGKGYQLGPKLIELGFRAHEQAHLPTIARPHLEALSAATSDTVHLGVLEGSEVIYLDKVSGRRSLEMRSRIGQRMPAQCTSLGKALLSDKPLARQRECFDPNGIRTASSCQTVEAFVSDIAAVRRDGVSFDLEENEAGIRCIAAPIRDARGAVVAAVSISSSLAHMGEDRLTGLRPVLCSAADAISRDLGWRPLSPESSDAF